MQTRVNVVLLLATERWQFGAAAEALAKRVFSQKQYVARRFKALATL